MFLVPRWRWQWWYKRQTKSTGVTSGDSPAQKFSFDSELVLIHICVSSILHFRLLCDGGHRLKIGFCWRVLLNWNTQLGISALKLQNSYFTCVSYYISYCIYSSRFLLWWRRWFQNIFVNEAHYAGLFLIAEWIWTAFWYSFYSM